MQQSHFVEKGHIKQFTLCKSFNSAERNNSKLKKYKVGQMYKIIGSVKSRTFRVLWMLEEMGLPYEYTHVPPHSKLVKQYNSSGKIPILIDLEAVITDSNAIMTYLADKHSTMTARAGSIERAHQDAISHRIIDEIDAVLWAASRSSLGLKELDNFPNINDRFKREYKRNLDRLEKQVKGPFMMGENLSLPDFILGHCAGWAYVAQFPAGNEMFGAYVKSLRTRPAYKTASRLDMSDD